eukprot:SAG22_NODE_487_length_9870_cov_13.118821_2_plen_46_part_00
MLAVGAATAGTDIHPSCTYARGLYHGPWHALYYATTLRQVRDVAE